MPDSFDETESEREVRITEALADFMSASDSGSGVNRDVDRESFLKQHSEIAKELSDLLLAADLIEQMAGPRLGEITTDSHDEYSASESVVQNEQTLPHISLNPSDPATKLTRQSAISDISQIALPCRFGDYILNRVLGRGGMGIVYSAQQISLERRVAVKMIRSGCLASEEEVHRFYAEARNSAKLSHPNIVRVYHIGECEGHHYFTMDEVDGESLSQKIHDGPLSGRQAAAYVSSVAKAIASAHHQGVLHRDLKPANVLIDNSTDKVLVTDFGLAKSLNAESGLTKTGATLGTPSYMPPEQAAGETRSLTEQSDVYSLGAVLFAALTGRPPFKSDSAVQTIMQVINVPPPLVRDISPQVHADLETIVSKCLHKQPLRRYENANALAEDLDCFLDGRPISAKPLSKLQKSLYWFAGIPLVTALFGSPSHNTEQSHHWAQRIIVFLVCLLPVGYFGLPALVHWWHNSHLPNKIQIASGVPEGNYYQVASRMAEAMNSKGQIAANPIVTEGSEDNVARLKSGEAQLGMLQASSLRDSQLSVVTPLYFDTVHVLIRKESGIKEADDLRGKRLLVGPLDSGMRLTALRLLQELRLDAGEVETVESDWTHDKIPNDVDAAVIVIRKGNAELKRVLSSGQFGLLPIENAIDFSLDEPTFRVYQISPSDYPGLELTEPIPTLATPAFLACRNDASAKMVEFALQIIFESDDPIDGLLSAATASHWQNSMMHPRARQYFQQMNLAPSSQPNTK